MVRGVMERKERRTLALAAPSNEVNRSATMASFSSFQATLALDQPSSLFTWGVIGIKKKRFTIKEPGSIYDVVTMKSRL